MFTPLYGAHDAKVSCVHSVFMPMRRRSRLCFDWAHFAVVCHGRQLLRKPTYYMLEVLSNPSSPKEGYLFEFVVSRSLETCRVPLELWRVEFPLTEEFTPDNLYLKHKVFLALPPALISSYTQSSYHFRSVILLTKSFPSWDGSIGLWWKKFRPTEAGLVMLTDIL